MGFNCLNTTEPLQGDSLLFTTKSIKSMFTCEISSRDETPPGMKPSLSKVKYLLLFTCFCSDEISYQDELIPVKMGGMKFHLDEKKKKTCKHFIPG